MQVVPIVSTENFSMAAQAYTLQPNLLNSFPAVQQVTPIHTTAAINSSHLKTFQEQRANQVNVIKQIILSSIEVHSRNRSS